MCVGLRSDLSLKNGLVTRVDSQGLPTESSESIDWMEAEPSRRRVRYASFYLQLCRIEWRA
jgi:hypothetical protein